MFYLTMRSARFIYGYTVSDISQWTTQTARRRHFMCYSFRLSANNILYEPSHHNTLTIRGAVAGTRNSSMGPP